MPQHFTCANGHRAEVAADCHRAPELPSVCPVCGAPVRPAPASTAEAMLGPVLAAFPTLSMPPRALSTQDAAAASAASLPPPSPPAADLQATLEPPLAPEAQPGAGPSASRDLPPGDRPASGSNSPDDLNLTRPMDAPVVDPHATVGSVVAANLHVTGNSAQACLLAAAPPVQEEYEILGELGRGGMGVVYKARQVKLKRLVALKMVLASCAGEEYLDRFRSEAEAVARLQHPNIIQIYEVGERDGQPYFSLEFVDGGTLEKKIAGTPQPPPEAARLVETLARAIHAAHEKGIVHRDLKPANVLLTQDGTPKITDFGLAKQLDNQSGHTQSGAIMGSPSYMAPEQALGRTHAIGPRSDVYALGAILYEMLTGRAPFRGASVWETIDQVRNQEPVPPVHLQPHLPRDLDTICLKCLQKEPGQRYATADALADDLRRFLNQEPILARPAGRCERLAKWARRSPAKASAVGIGITAAGVLLVLTLLWYQQKLQTDEAELQAARGRVQTALARAQLAETKLKERQRLEAKRTAGQKHVLAAQAALQARDPTAAQLHLEKAQAMFRAEPSLAGLRKQVAALLTRTGQWQNTRRQWQEARRLHDEALLFSFHFGGLDRASNLKKARTAAQAALTLCGITPGTDAPLVLNRSHFSAPERAEMTSACYELLLILAEVVAQPLQGEAPRDQAGKALRFLDQAARLRPPTLPYHLLRANYLAQRGDLAAAVRARRQAGRIGQAAGSALDQFLLGEERYQREDLPAAITHFQEALQQDPRHFWAQFLMAVCHLKQRRHDEARLGLSACLRSRPDFTWLYLLRGFAEGELGEAALANPLLKPVLRSARAERHFRAAEADFQKAAQLPHNEDADYVLRVNRGVLRIRRKQFDDALADLRKARRLQPDQYQTYLNLAKAHQEQGDLGRAIQVLDQAIGRKMKLPALYRLRAQLHLKRHPPDRPAALRDLEEAIRREPAGSTSTDLAADHKERALLLVRARRYEEAVAACDRALKISPHYAIALRLRAEALIKLDRYPEAIASLNRYLDHALHFLDAYQKGKEPVADVYRRRAQARGKLGQFAAALDDYTRALEIDPNAGSYAFRGWLYLANDAPKLALPDFEQALRFDPKNADACNGRGYARARLNQYRAGVADAEEALRLGPRDARLVYNAARTYAQASTMALVDQSRGERPAHELSGQYQKRALELIRQALAFCQGPAERAEFSQSYLQTDPALRLLRRTAGYVRLARKYFPQAPPSSPLLPAFHPTGLAPR